MTNLKQRAGNRPPFTLYIIGSFTEEAGKIKQQQQRNRARGDRHGQGCEVAPWLADLMTLQSQRQLAQLGLKGILP